MQKMKTTVKRGLVLRYLVPGLLLSEEYKMVNFMVGELHLNFKKGRTQYSVNLRIGTVWKKPSQRVSFHIILIF